MDKTILKKNQKNQKMCGLCAIFYIGHIHDVIMRLATVAKVESQVLFSDAWCVATLMAESSAEKQGN